MPLKIEDLLDMTVSDLLDNYVLLYSPECDYSYGIADADDVESTFKEYDLEDQASMAVEPIIDFDIIGDSDDEILTTEKIHEIMKNIGIEKKIPDELLECRPHD